jgi:hypothetical protein
MDDCHLGRRGEKKQQHCLGWGWWLRQNCKQANKQAKRACTVAPNYVTFGLLSLNYIKLQLPKIAFTIAFTLQLLPSAGINVLDTIECESVSVRDTMH